MDLENIILEKENRIGKITLNRPDVLNALDKKTYSEIGTAIEDVREDKDIRVVIITGAGKAFCSGLDLTYAATIVDMSPLEFRSTIRRLQEIFRLERLEKPVIAAVNGYAMGNGCDLALACDFRIASENARFEMTYVKLGLIPDIGGTYRLARLVGLGKAKELILTGDRIDTKEAERIGLVNRVVPANELESATMKFAEKLAKGAPVAIGLSKMAINSAIDTNLSAALENEVYGQSLCLQTEDVKEGTMARLQRREPKFTGN